MKCFSLLTAVAFALTQSVVDGALSVTSTEPTRSNNGPFLEKVWIIEGDAGDMLDDLKVQVAGNVFVDYDASLAADGNVAARVIMRSSSPDMVGLVDVVVHEADGNGIRIHYKNTNARVVGEVVTQIIVSDRNALSSVSATHSDSVVLGDGVVVKDDPSTSLELDTSGDAAIYVGSLTQDQVVLKSLSIASSGDGYVQFLASSIQADAITVSLSGDSKAVVAATDHITVDSMVSAISGDGKIFVETANLQAQKLSATLSGDGKVSYSSSGSCVDQTIHLSGDASVYAGSIVCKNSMVATSGDGKAIVQTTDTLTSVGGGSVKYVNAAPHRIVSSSIFRKHSNVKPAKYNKFKTRRPSTPPTRAPTELTVVVKAAWFGDAPHVSVYSGIGNSIFIDGTGFAVANIPAYQRGVGFFGVFVAVAAVATMALIAVKVRESKTRKQYAPLA
ncbi:putative auto-transporter adhesin head GIN domain-containing protein [Phytophthora infestans]|nr:putative auto-transporter adhesin head GIN domain-containing protein [Phytophthora infestans]